MKEIKVCYGVDEKTQAIYDISPTTKAYGLGVLPHDSFARVFEWSEDLVSPLSDES